VPKNIKQGFTYCDNGEKTNLESLINIEGYYVEAKPLLDSKVGTYYINFMFYDDGSFVYGFYDCNSEKREKGKSNIPLYFDEIISDNEGEISKSFYNSFYWGRYLISGDTIKTQYINHPVSISPDWAAWEIWYKVIDRNTIIEIYSKPIHYMSESDCKNYQEYKKKEKPNFPAKFIAVEKKPVPNCWLKQEDWFWCKNRNVK